MSDSEDDDPGRNRPVCRRRDEICSSLGVPPELVRDDPGTTYRNLANTANGDHMMTPAEIVEYLRSVKSPYAGRAADLIESLKCENARLKDDIAAREAQATGSQPVEPPPACPACGGTGDDHAAPQPGKGCRL